MANRPKTGEKRRTRQPLKMDKLPAELLDRVIAERAAGRTWEEMEELSPRFEEWDKTSEAIRAQFPGLRLPRVTLQRWYDIRVEQVKREMLADQVRAREIAAMFSNKSFEDQQVFNALGDQIFGLMQSSNSGDKKKSIAFLLALGELVNDRNKVRLKQKQVATDERRIALLERDFEIRKRKFEEETDKAARKLGKGKAITTEDINRIRERTFGLPPVQRGAASSTAA
jgi:hypothetical protein